MDGRTSIGPTGKRLLVAGTLLLTFFSSTGCFPLVSTGMQSNSDGGWETAMGLTVPIPLRNPAGRLDVPFAELSYSGVGGLVEATRPHYSLGFGKAYRYSERWNCWTAGLTCVNIDSSPDGVSPRIRQSSYGGYVTFRHFGYNCGGPVLTLTYAPDIMVAGVNQRQSSAYIGWQWGVEPARSAARGMDQNDELGMAYFMFGAAWLITGDLDWL